MKKYIIYTLAGFLALTFIPAESKASTGITSGTETATPAIEKSVLLNRLEEIKAINKTDLSSKDKKVLHKETRSIQKKLHHLSGGVYISAGALIVIIIILILIL
jgi:hypothetical protein